MTNEVKNELKTWAQYFLIALVAELGAAFGWLQEQYGDEDIIFNVFIMLIDHEKPRLLLWFLIFAILSTIRFLIRRYRKHVWPDWLSSTNERDLSK